MTDRDPGGSSRAASDLGDDQDELESNLRDLETELSDVTNEWAVPVLVRSYGLDDDGPEDRADEAVILEAHGYDESAVRDGIEASLVTYTNRDASRQEAWVRLRVVAGWSGIAMAIVPLAAAYLFRVASQPWQGAGLAVNGLVGMPFVAYLWRRHQRAGGPVFLLLTGAFLGAEVISAAGSLLLEIGAVDLRLVSSISSVTQGIAIAWLVVLDIVVREDPAVPHLGVAMLFRPRTDPAVPFIGVAILTRYMLLASLTPPPTTSDLYASVVVVAFLVTLDWSFVVGRRLLRENAVMAAAQRPTARRRYATSI